MHVRACHRAVLIHFLFIASTAIVSAAAAQPQITGQVDDSSRVPLPNSHLAINPAYDLGALDQSRPLDRMILVLNMAAQQQHELATLLDTQQTKGSPSYHRWLTPAQFGQQYGPVQEDVAKISAWLQQQGFWKIKPSTSRLWIEFSGTVGLVNQAFRTEIHAYQVAGETHIGNSTDISVPAALVPLVNGVPLHDFFSKPAFVRSPARPDITNSAGAHAVTPGDLAAIYDLTPLYKANLNGAGQTIAIVSRSDINPSDVAQFQKIFGLPANAPQVIDNGIAPGVDPSGDGAESTLDTEWAVAVATGAKIVLVPSVSTTTTDGVVLSASYIVDQDLGQIVNVSFSNCEPNLGTAGNAFFSNLWQQAAAQGMSVFVAAGDSGAEACAPTGIVGPGDDFIDAVNGVASTPFDTAVGGTEFDETVNGGSASTYWSTTNGSNLASALGYIPEMVWNDDTSTGVLIVLGAGGGISTIYPISPWQRLNVTGLQVLSTYSLPGQSGVTPRGIPDVSLEASPVNDPFLFCFTSPLTPTPPDCQLENGTLGANTFQNAGGGTSFSSPIFAGLMAIINQKTQSDNPSSSADGRQGLANYVLYPLATAEDFSSCNSSARTNPKTPALAACVFNDITIGNNDVPDLTDYYSATIGFDLASGLGSVDANNLVTNWNTTAASFHGSQTTLTSSPGSLSITHGQSVTFDASVQKLTGDSATQIPSGSVSLIAGGGTLTGSFGLVAGTLSGASSPVSTGNLAVSNLPGGTYSVLANFPGDGFYAPSLSNSIAVTVAPEPSTTSIGGPSSFPYGTFPLELAALVTGVSGQGEPSGQITFTDGGILLGTGNLNNVGLASFLNCPLANGTTIPPVPSTPPCLSVGTHEITATYSGDSSFLPSPIAPAASQILNLTITKGELPLYVSCQGTPPNYLINQPCMLTAALQGVSPAAVPPIGTVQFLDGTTSLGQANVVTVNSLQQASIQVTLSQGQHNLSASYSGDMFWAAESATQQWDIGVPIGWAANSTTATINPGQTATYNLTLSTATGFTGQVALTCIPGNDPSNSGTPPTGVQCTVQPSSVNFTSSATSFPATVTLTTTSLSRMQPFPFGMLPFAVAGALAFGFRRRKSSGSLAVFVAAALALSAATSCGGGNTPTPVGPPAVSTTYSVWATYPVSPSNETLSTGVVLTLNINQ
jgi:hypothetical protein